MSTSFSLSKINPKLLRRIYRACRPSLDEPNLALNLEICDYVNAKQGSIPREAAITVAKLISQRDPQTSELALALLDNLVKNCGYPFHLQISRKEFLNELVKRFPERPPLRYSRVQRLILAQIEEWYQTICKTSKYREDFGSIKDMHRLLSHKGYVFPEVKIEDAAVLNPSDTLQTFEDLQREEEVVNSAKLQELIRRGRPQDLQEANKLMKIMAGFKESAKAQENKQQIDDDLSRLKRKSEILDEMLTNLQQSGGKIDDSSEALHELYGSIKVSQPIINKIIDEEHDNDAKIAELLALNDSINGLINKFQLLKGGNIEEASKIKATFHQELNLIDFDDDEPISNNQSDNQGYDDLLADLSNLSFGNDVKKSNGDILNLFGAGGSIALGSNTPQPETVGPSSSRSQPIKSGDDFDLLGDFKSPSPQLQSNVGLDPFNLNFPASTPPQTQVPTQVSNNTKTLINQSANLKIEAELSTSGSNTSGMFLFSNANSSTLSKVKFSVAAPKSCKLDLDAQTSDFIYGFTSNGIKQAFTIENALNKQLKVKWKVEYVLGGQTVEETGVSNLTETN